VVIDYLKYISLLPSRYYLLVNTNRISCTIRQHLLPQKTPVFSNTAANIKSCNIQVVFLILQARD